MSHPCAYCHAHVLTVTLMCPVCSLVQGPQGARGAPGSGADIRITQISAAASVTLYAVTERGDLYAWGYNSR